jgi:uncharacterized protein YjbI with pentapeptide repeats
MSRAHAPKDLTRYGAYYRAGLTIEADFKSDPPRLSIDGQKIKIKRSHRMFQYSHPGRVFKSATLRDLAYQIIDVLWDRKGREKIRDEHVEKLKKRKSWDAWRRKNPSIRPLLFNAPLRNGKFANFNFCNANLIRADLRDATLNGANFHEANLGGARLNGAKLRRANFCRTDLYETNFSRSKLGAADLTRANLQGTQLARTKFKGAKLDGCKIYGLSSWNLQLSGTEQRNLKILYRTYEGSYKEGEFPVNDLEFAQLVFLLLDNKKINKLFDQLNSKAVVIMSRFEGKEHQQVIDQLRRSLRKHNLVPIVFDFKRPPARDLTETIKTLVGLCHFAIVDITDPKSVPLELYATVRDYQVPFVPIIKTGHKPFALFEDFKKFSWMLDQVPYKSPETLSEDFVKRHIIDKASKMWEQIRQFKTRPKRK